MQSDDKHQTIVDYAALSQIDRELDDALERREWTVEYLATLHAKAVTAVAGHKDTLAFLREVGDIAWTVGDSHGLGWRRLPGQVRELIHLLSGGWAPFVALPKGSSLRWNGHDLNVHEVEVFLRSDSATVVAHLIADAIEDYRDVVPKEGLVSDTLHARLASGWMFDSPTSIRTHRRETQTGSEHQIDYQFRANNVRLMRGDHPPQIWIIPLGLNISLPLNTNLFRTSWIFLFNEPAGSSANWLGLHFHGFFPYTLVQFQREGDRKESFLIVQTRERELDVGALNRDLLALQFTLGQSIDPELAYGLQGMDVIAIQHVTQGPDFIKSQIHTVPNDISTKHPWTVVFFEGLSEAFRGKFCSVLTATLRLYLRAFDSLLDVSIRELLSGMTVFTYTENSSQQTLSEKARIQLAAGGVTLPAEIQSHIDEVAQKLAIQGALTIGATRDQVARYIRIRDEIRSVLIALIAISVGYTGPIVGDPRKDRSPSWWPSAKGSPTVATWSASRPPEDGLCGVEPEQLLILVERPEHEVVARWAIKAANIPNHRLVFASTGGRPGLHRAVKYAEKLQDRLIVIAESPFKHVPTAIESLRGELDLLSSKALVCPAICCIEAWLLADDNLVRVQCPDRIALRRATEVLPEELSDARALAHQIFGPTHFWHEIPSADVYRAAERSPSLRRFLVTIAHALGIKVDLPTQSVSRAISRNAIAGLIRDLLSADTIAWRTSDDHTFTAEDLAREVEQGTETGRQYTLDLISMMINMLSRRARIKSQS